MRIAQVSPLFESVPPKLYGGTERIVHSLTENLIDQGHDVTLYASGDSFSRAKLRSPCDRALRLSGDKRDAMISHLLMMEQVLADEREFDIIHFHTEAVHFPFARRTSVPTLTTLHGRLDLPDYPPFFRSYLEIPLVSISNAQRRPLPFANWVGTVHHGLAADRLRFHPSGGDYLAFLGRISPEKRFDRAVAIARRCDLKLKVAAKIDAVADAEYIARVRHLLEDPCVEFVGEIGDDEKSEFLGNARALLFPIDWPEPFGLVMIEALACGTPVIGFRNGSVSEIVRDGVTGFIVDSVEEAVAAVFRTDVIDRSACRAEFESRFSVARMAQDYFRIYESLVPDHRGPLPPRTTQFPHPASAGGLH